MYTVDKIVKFSTEFLSKLRHFLFFFKFTSLNFVCIRKIFHFMIYLWYITFRYWKKNIFQIYEIAEIKLINQISPIIVYPNAKKKYFDEIVKIFADCRFSLAFPSKMNSCQLFTMWLPTLPWQWNPLIFFRRITSPATPTHFMNSKLVISL